LAGPRTSEPPPEGQSGVIPFPSSVCPLRYVCRGSPARARGWYSGIAFRCNYSSASPPFLRMRPLPASFHVFFSLVIAKERLFLRRRHFRPSVFFSSLFDALAFFLCSLFFFLFRVFRRCCAMFREVNLHSLRSVLLQPPARSPEVPGTLFSPL